jgi:thiol-disulfide isomerase/thioredoxin
MMSVVLVCILVASPREQFEALLKQHDPMPPAVRNDPTQAKAAFQPFLNLARENPHDTVAADALNWVITHADSIGSVDEAMELIVRDHAASERLLPIIQRLDQFTDTTPSSLGLLRAVLRKNSHRETRAWACLVLGRSIAKGKNLIQCQRGRLELTLHANPKLKAKPVTIGDGEIDANLAAMGVEAGGLFERVIREFADFHDLTDTAGKELFELRHLAIGSVAPEIEGRDVGGKPFKLSDYRGKVILLDFWSLTCPACVAEFPRLRQLVKRFEDQPFVLLGINSGDKTSELLSLRQRGEINWRCWCDGPDDIGPIVQRWNVWNFPTSYFIDQQGVIRYKDLRINNIPAAIDILSKKAAPEPRF